MKDNYSFFLFSQLYSVTHPNDPTPYDMLFGDLQKLHSDFEESLYNDPDKGEYECMVDFLNAYKDIIIKPAKEENKVLLIDREKFLDWYFDNDTAEGFFHTFDVLGYLKSEGVFGVHAESLLDDCGYIPEWVVDESQTDVKLIDENDVDTSYYDEIKFAK